jgi:NNP family nitrate/nitrite transporter-like MFS transporter
VPYQLKGTPNKGLTGATVGFFFGFAAVALFGPTASKFSEVMQLSATQVGLLVAVPSLSGSLLRIPFSAWVESNGGRKPFMILMAASVAGMAGLTLFIYSFYPDSMSVSSYPLILILGILCGCGIATFSVGISQVAYWFPQNRQGWALGTYAGLGNIAPGMFSFLIPIALLSLGLAGSYLSWLIFLVIGTALYYHLSGNAWYFQLKKQGVSDEKAKQIAGEHGQEIFPTGTPWQSLVSSAKAWKTWPLVILYFTSFGGFLALTAWFPTYWKSFHGASGATAGLLTALFAIITSVIRVPGGSISDRIGGESTALLSLLALLFGSILMVLSGNYYLSITAEVIMAVGMGINNAAVFKLVPKTVPQAVGGAAGWVGGLGAFGGFAVPPVMGLFVENMGDSGYARGFAVFIGLAGLSLLFAYILKRVIGKDMAVELSTA